MSDEPTYDWQRPDYTKFDFGEVFSRSFQAVLARLKDIGLLALALVGGPSLIFNMSDYLLARSNDMAVILVVVACILLLIGTVLLQAILVQIFVRYFWGEHLRVDEALKTALSRFWPIIGGSILIGLGIVLGFMLLIIPGIILAVGWYMFLPVVIGERRGPIDSISRSWELSRGFKWHIFGIVICAGLVTLFIGLVMGAIGGLFVGLEAVIMDPEAHIGKVAAFALIQSLVSIISTFISTAIIASIYVELMRVKGEHDVNRAEAVFD